MRTRGEELNWRGTGLNFQPHYDDRFPTRVLWDEPCKNCGYLGCMHDEAEDVTQRRCPQGVSAGVDGVYISCQALKTLLDYVTDDLYDDETCEETRRAMLQAHDAIKLFEAK